MHDAAVTPDRPLREPYPAIAPYDCGRLRVSPLHELYYEQCGNPAGKPVVMIHGGPGGGSNPFMRRLHDPARHRIVLFDQRGCGQSTPRGALDDNTTWHLVADMETLRRHLGIERWQLCGGSWGSTLALAYAQTHRERVSELVLRGIFLLRRQEIEWFYQKGCSELFPDAWERFVAPIPHDERGDLVAAYHRRLMGPDDAERLACARAWSEWEGTTISLTADPARQSRFAAPAFASVFARIECHYFHHRGFLAADDQLLAGAAALAGLPGVIVHGRYDVVTPLANAWALSKAWPGVRLRIAEASGHTMTEPAITHELVVATDSFRDA